MSIRRYNTVSALADDFASDPGCGDNYHLDSHWFGDSDLDGRSIQRSWQEEVKMAKEGDISYVPAAMKLLDKLNSGIEVPKREWVASDSGAYPMVPDYLAGTPNPMRRLSHIEEETAPLQVFVVLSCSSGVDAKVLRERGVAILALVMAMQQVRPVTLEVMNIGGSIEEYVCVVPINTQPLSLAHACHVMSSMGFVRRLCYGLEKRHTGMLSWPSLYRRDPQLYLDGLKYRLGGKAHDLIIGPAFYSEGRDDTGSYTKNGQFDSVGWVNNQIKLLAHEEPAE